MVAPGNAAGIVYRRQVPPDRRECQHCLDVARHGRQMQQECKQSPEGFAGALKDLHRLGRQYAKQRPRRVIVEMTPGEVGLLVKYARPVERHCLRPSV